MFMQQSAAVLSVDVNSLMALFYFRIDGIVAIL